VRPPVRFMAVCACFLWASLTPAFAESRPIAGPLAKPPVVVASKVDTEGALLGNMIALVLDRQGIPVEARIGFGPTREVRDAILSGAIDIYPEYTGNGAFFHGTEQDQGWRAATYAYETVRRLDRERYDLVWLDRAPANNTWLIALRGDVARRRNLVTMEDFARAVAQSEPLILAASAEFVESPAALPAFERTYGFRFPRDRILVQPGGDTAVTMRAAAQGAKGVNAAMVYGTDGAIAAFDLVVMSDVRGAQIVYEPAPVVRGEVLRSYPGIARVLAPVFASLSMSRLQSLNAQIAIEGLSASEVAREYLDQNGFLR
jgi:osmoprotectant transport system substrate-binding protein